MDLEPSLEYAQRDSIELLVDNHATEQGVMVAFSCRIGGVSEPPFDTLNLSTKEGDSAENVDQNRALLARAVGVEPASLAFGRQVHGAQVIDAQPGMEPATGDVFVTRSHGTTVGVLTADCVPAVVFGEDGIAAIHAGWRGVVAGAVEEGASRVGAPIVAWIGPSIHACCYEVGPDVVTAFEEKALPIADSWHVDPAQAVRAILRRVGFERIAASNTCTSCDKRYFSARRDKRTGRQAGVAALL